jgi:hypothetical protein
MCSDRKCMMHAQATNALSPLRLYLALFPGMAFTRTVTFWPLCKMDTSPVKILSTKAGEISLRNFLHSLWISHFWQSQHRSAKFLCKQQERNLMPLGLIYNQATLDNFRVQLIELSLSICKSPKMWCGMRRETLMYLLPTTWLWGLMTSLKSLLRESNSWLRYSLLIVGCYMLTIIRRVHQLSHGDAPTVSCPTPRKSTTQSWSLECQWATMATLKPLHPSLKQTL